MFWTRTRSATPPSVSACPCARISTGPLAAISVTCWPAANEQVGNQHVDGQRSAGRQRSLQSMALQARGVLHEIRRGAGHAARLRLDVDDCDARPPRQRPAQHEHRNFHFDGNRHIQSPGIRSRAAHADRDALAQSRRALLERLQRLIARFHAQTRIELRCGHELLRMAGGQARAHELFGSGLHVVDRLRRGERSGCEQRADHQQELRTESLHECQRR